MAGNKKVNALVNLSVFTVHLKREQANSLHKIIKLTPTGSKFTRKFVMAAVCLLTAGA